MDGLGFRYVVVVVVVANKNIFLCRLLFIFLKTKTYPHRTHFISLFFMDICGETTAG